MNKNINRAIYVNEDKDLFITPIIVYIDYNYLSNLATLSTLKVLNTLSALNAVNEDDDLENKTSIKLNITTVASKKFILSFKYFLKPKPNNFITSSTQNITVNMLLDILSIYI
jgi:hypothetical protein